MRNDSIAAGGERIAEVVKLVTTRVATDEQRVAEAFVRAYFRQVDPADLAERSPADLYGAALSHWQFGRRRDPGSAKLRVFNPTIEEHGWQSTHTVVEIVNDDMPFLVDSVTMAVNQRGHMLHLIVHPIIIVSRDGSGHIVDLPEDAEAVETAATAQRDARAARAVAAAVANPAAAVADPATAVAQAGPRGAPAGNAAPVSTLRESFMHVEVDRIGDPEEMRSLEAEIASALADVRAAVSDWRPMVARLREIVAEIDRNPPPIDAAELGEARAFLDWLAQNHFTFVGYRCHDLVSLDGEDGLRLVPGSALGILRETPKDGLSSSFARLPTRLRERARTRELLVLTKANWRSTVHRPGALDYVGIKRFDAAGNVCGEHRFLGLYTSTAYMTLPEEIPVLRRKVAAVIERAGLLPRSHAGKALANILHTYPRDELIQAGVDELFDTAMGILHLGERQRFRLFVRSDPFERFASCLIYVPRENYNTSLRRKWQEILCASFNGTASDFGVFLSESPLARIHITIRTTPGAIPPFDVDEIEARLAAAARRWEDDLREALVEATGEARASELYRRWGNAFPAAYREDFDARAAVPDLEAIASLSAARPLAMRLYRPLEAPASSLRFKLLRHGAPMVLSESLPMLERMGFSVQEERPYRVESEDGETVWIHDFGMLARDGAEIEIDAIHEAFEDAFARTYSGDVESDDLNRLVVIARLSADEVVVLRACAKYLRQIGFGLSQAFIAQTLNAQPGIARLLVNLFRLRFDPDLTGEAAEPDAEPRQVRAIESALDSVTNLSEDRVLRGLLALIRAMTRTNFWVRDAQGRRRPYLSFKLDPSRVPGMPEPRPMFEIFVYSPRFEGVHLRGGKVARGGLRWSDRPEDFRTEVLGLMKAQMVKNTVIVPVGSKGGFVLKRPPPAGDREALLREGVACYQDYLRGLLDITDNRVGQHVVPPERVRRQDPDDPYLVVAADKGTASFSDYANAVSKEYGFWLGDAFASGGSAGYDHKGMGITARGAWASVQRHFREMGVDVQATDFSVVGIGDMSGDVFGNGMLRSEHTRLVAAFDHRHVFLDPDPDPVRSFAERNRLFGLPRSSWADYDVSLISSGGGVWPRSAKSIPISPQVRAVLGVEAETLPPNELISAILKAPVDLLYNGGIGTYVKASGESHAEVGDRANDPVRVDGCELRCKVVAEGGNLGLTQLGRVEYALAGGRIFTDAIDNSAGVDTSDHEVNLKILLGLAIADGELTEKQRNTVLAGMTDEVAALVLRDNRFQTQILSLERRLGVRMLDAQARAIRFLEKAGRLNRRIEFLPDDEELEARRARGIGLTAPENAVLLAYSKIWLYDELLASKLPDDPWVATALERYFPHAVRQRFAAYLPRHPLSREIIATHVVNSTLNRVGSTFVHSLSESTGATPADVVRAYLLQREVFGHVATWKQIESLDAEVNDDAQAEMLIELGRLTMRGTQWFLRSRRLPDDMGRTIAHFASRVAELRERLPELLDADARERLRLSVATRVATGVPAGLATTIVAIDPLAAALDLVETADATTQPVDAVASVHFALDGVLGLSWLRETVTALPADSHWQTLAKSALRDDLAELQRTLTASVITGGDGAASPADKLAAWSGHSAAALDRARRVIAELHAVPAPDLAMLSVALRELRNLA